MKLTLIKYFSQIKNHMVRKIHLNTSLDMTMVIGYVKNSDSNKKMSFKATDKKLLKKCTKIWERVGS